jgi:acetylornithine deacetylase/succinyl-diaminopimelate desuccinylase-like protein
VVLHERIESKSNEYLNLLFQLLRQPSISAQDVGMTECVELLSSIMRDSGIDTQIFQTEGHPILYGEVISPKNTFTLLFYGHYDVQPPDPYDQWVSPPFEPEIRNGKIYARGAGDNKGQLLAHVLAIKTMIDTYGELPINVKLIFDGEEESLSKSFAPFVKKHKKLLQADVVYTSDGPLHSNGDPMVMLGCRGMLYVEMTTKGASRDNHSGNKGGIAPNPAWMLIHALNTMYSPEGTVLIDGFYDDVQLPTEYERKLLQQLPFDSAEIAQVIGLEKLDLNAETYYQRLSFQPTFNISGFISGYGGEGAKTIIPSEAKVKMDLRLAVNQDPNDIYQKIESHIEKYKLPVDISCLGMVSPSKTPIDLDIVQKVIASVEKVHKKKVLVIPAIGATFPDYIFTQILGLPSILVPYANADEDNHSPNENLDVSCFFNVIKTTCQVITDLAIS